MLHLKIKKFWDKQLKSHPASSFYTGLEQIDFEEFCQKIKSEDQKYLEKIILNIINGKAILLKSAFKKDFVENLKTNVKKFWEKNPDVFNKMNEGVKDFHRIIDKERSSKYSVTAVKHAAYFFPWNNDPCSINKKIFSRWGYIKVLQGQSFNQYTNNTPKDGKVDRIQIAVYPPGFGEIKLHTDPIHNQYVSLCGYLSSINGSGNDFKTGGVYCLDKNKNKINLEKYIDVGDIGLFFGGLKHGVDPIDNDKDSSIKNYDWFSGKGRWFMGLYTNDSDIVKKRITSIDLKDNLQTEAKNN